MNQSMISGILTARKKLKRSTKITVTGISMEPTLKEGDIITVAPQDSYCVGDILVFFYKQGELLVHRLLEIKDDTYYCKGDNAFRLEDIKDCQIMGKVIEAARGKIPLELEISNRVAELSLEVNREFIRRRYDVDSTKDTIIYGLYKAEITGDRDYAVKEE